ncbi:MAG: DUF898 family protein [Hyphomicrobiales bacterium]|nr:DUF898 family protein [Hyphomicrobiales bacterium]
MSDPGAPVTGRVRFCGDAREFWPLLLRGAGLLMLTLGIYRFWLTTDIRRLLWANTELAGDSFEYIGTARELLIGFLIAIVILVPLNAAIFVSAISIGDGTGLLGVGLLTVLGQYAVYRARRYRLTRTLFRGVRFHQTGSAWRYAICALLWWVPILLTLGLAYPFAQARLERYKLRHTHFGDLPGRFEGSGLGLFLRGGILWLLTMVPFIAGVAAMLAAIDWEALAREAGGDDTLGWLDASGLPGAVVYAGLAAVWLLASIAILYPLFQAILLRWWASGLRFGDVAVTCRLRNTQVLAVYARFLGYALLFTLMAAVVIGLGWLALSKLTGEIDSMLDEIMTTMAAIAAYVASALGYSAIYQGTVKLGLWRCLVESLEISNLATLEHVQARGYSASAVGEGLADALSVGGV